MGVRMSGLVFLVQVLSLGQSETLKFVASKLGAI